QTCALPIYREIEPHNNEQHEHRTEQRIQEELDGGVLAAGTAPYSDEKIQRQQHQFVEDVEQEEVECREHTHHGHIEDHQQHKIAFCAFLHIPRCTDSNDHHQGG